MKSFFYHYIFWILALRTLFVGSSLTGRTKPSGIGHLTGRDPWSPSASRICRLSSHPNDSFSTFSFLSSSLRLLSPTAYPLEGVREVSRSQCSLQSSSPIVKLRGGSPYSFSPSSSSPSSSSPSPPLFFPSSPSSLPSSSLHPSGRGSALRALLSSPAQEKLSRMDDGKDRSGSLAVIHIMGRQRWVELGRYFDAYRMKQVPGRHVYLHRVLFYRSPEGIDMVGRPFVENVRITAVVICHFRGRKQHILRFKPKIRYKRMVGFRQEFTRLRIEAIEVLPPFYTADEPEEIRQDKQDETKEETARGYVERGAHRRVRSITQLESKTLVDSSILEKELRKEKLKVQLEQKHMGLPNLTGWEEEDTHDYHSTDPSSFSRSPFTASRSATPALTFPDTSSSSPSSPPPDKYSPSAKVSPSGRGSPPTSGGRSKGYAPWPGLGGVDQHGRADRRLQLRRMYLLRINNRNCRNLKNFILGDPVYCFLRQIERAEKPSSVLKYVKHQLNKRKLPLDILDKDFEGHTPFSHFDPLVSRKVTENLMEKMA